MAKRVIKLNESDLQKIVEECTRQIINESVEEGALWQGLKGAFQGARQANQANRADRREARAAEKGARQAQKSFDRYMSQADKDIEVLSKMLERYKQDPNAGNVVDKLSRAIGAIRPKETDKANKNSYYSRQQASLDNARQNRDNTVAQSKQHIQTRTQSIQTNMRNTFSGNQPEVYSQVV